MLDASARGHARVLRLSSGDAVTLFDGAGRIAAATVVNVEPELALEAQPSEAVPAPEGALSLILALPRAGKLDDVLRAVTELGAQRVQLAITERSVPGVPAAKLAKKRARWGKVVQEAARQSERSFLPVVTPPEQLLDAAAATPADATRLVFAARGAGPLAGSLAKHIVACVGPEGGFTDAELRALDGLGYRRVSLGGNVLRAETAAISATAVLMQRVWLARE